MKFAFKNTPNLNYLIFILFTLLLCVNKNVNAQYIFDEKFEGCATEHFTTEKNTIKVASAKYDITYVLSNNLSFENVKKIRGSLSLQIIVDQEGKSCLLSVKNNTNISTKELDLKKTIDNQLLWEKPIEKTSVLISIQFYKNGIEKKRIGMSQKQGFHQIKM